MIVYRKTSGRAHDLRFVPDDYVVEEGEIVIDSSELPDIEALHDPVPENVARNAEIDALIAALERTSPGGVYVRGLREFMLAETITWNRVRDVASRAAAGEYATVQAFGAALAAMIPDFLANKGMQNVKALDDAIRAERAKRQP